MKIRRAGKEDIQALAVLEAGYPEYPAWKEKGLGAELEKPFAVTLMAEKDGQAAGFISFWVIRPVVELNALLVDRKAGRSGIGSALMKKMFEYALKNDCSGVDLEVAENNIPAVSLYLKLGFRKVSFRPDYYEGKINALLMRKDMEVKGKSL